MRDQNERSCKIIKFIAASLKAFTRSDWTICLGSIAVLAITFLLSERNNGMIFITSVAGIWCLIFIAKGNVLGQVLTVIFALFYGYVSWQYHYYGEMITYLGMSAPTAAIAAVSWWRHPYSDTEVKVEVVKLPAWVGLGVVMVIVTVVFYFILGWLGTPNLIVSTMSVATSFMAAALMFLRSRFYAIAYMSNDLILVVLWLFAARTDASYLTMAVNFMIFFINDLYGFFGWKAIDKKQKMNRC